MLCSRRTLRRAAPLAIAVLLAACSDNGREPVLSRVTPIEIPAADTTTKTNFNTPNPSLQVLSTFPVADGDLLTLVWSDEFDGAALDPDVWFFETGDGSQYGIPGWGNNEEQYYLPDSARLEDGKLKITARRETVGEFGFTSARISTQDRIAVKYGRIEASMKLPAGQGVWPAFWMLPQADQQGAPPAQGVYGGFSQSGEIDIMEAVNLGGSPGPAGIGGGNEIFGTIHFGGEFPANQFSSIELSASESLTEQFNTFAVEWDEFEIRWYFNGNLYAVQNSWFSNAAPFPAPFDQPFEIILNLAVGGNLPGPPDGSTQLPATMEVEYVRVYSGEAPAVMPADPGTIPDAVVYASDPAVIEDLAFPGLDTFGSGASFDADFNADADFSPAFRVTSGNAFGGEDVGFVAFVGYGSGFASGFETLQFKVKDLPNDEIEVKFFAPDSGNVYNVTSYSGSTELGNGWYELSIPMSDFGDAAAISGFTGFLLGPQGDQGAPFSFLLTDIGLSGMTAGPPPFDSGLLSNGDFESGATPWLAGVTNPIDPANVIDDAGNQVFFVDVTAAGNPFDVNLSQKLAITPDETYTLSFMARSNVARSIVAGIGLSGGSFANTVQTVDLTTDWQMFSLELTATGFGDADSRVLFDLGAEVGEVYIDEVSLVVSTGGGGGGGVAGDLAVNGDFEAGDFSGWQQFVNSGVQMISTDTSPTGGMFSGAISANVAPGSGGTTEIKQANLGAGTLALGDVLTITFDVKGSFGPGGQLNVLSFTEISGGGADLSDQTVIAGGVDDWTTQTYDVTLSGADAGGGFSLAFNAVCGAVPDCIANVFIDNVSIVTN